MLSKSKAGLKGGTVKCIPKFAVTRNEVSKFSSWTLKACVKMMLQQSGHVMARVHGSRLFSMHNTTLCGLRVFVPVLVCLQHCLSPVLLFKKEEAQFDFCWLLMLRISVDSVYAWPRLSSGEVWDHRNSGTPRGGERGGGNLSKNLFFDMSTTTTG